MEEALVTEAVRERVLESRERLVDTLRCNPAMGAYVKTTHALINDDLHLLNALLEDLR